MNSTIRQTEKKDATEKGNFLRVWRREKGEKWRIVVDVQRALPPPAGKTN